MTRFKRLATFALLVILALVALFFGAEVGIRSYLEKGRAQNEIVEKERLTIAINLFHARYHQWPGPDGPIDGDTFTELWGFKDATINTSHIDFFKKAGASIAAFDAKGRVLFFRTDDSKGTCTVYSETEP